MSRPRVLPDAGEIIWTDFDPTRGREQAGRRPALVISPRVFCENTGLAIVAPITSRIRPFPTSVVLPPEVPITGEILLSHLRSIDLDARPVRATGMRIPDHLAALVRAKLMAIMAL
jgi:mRNA interferase MazF